MIPNVAIIYFHGYLSFPIKATQAKKKGVWFKGLRWCRSDFWVHRQWLSI